MHAFTGPFPEVRTQEGNNGRLAVPQMPEAAGKKGQSGADDGTATAKRKRKERTETEGQSRTKKSALKRIAKGDSGAARTRDPQLRRLLLYPTELRNPD